jgi:cytochrome c oxidase subunit 6b
MSGMSKIFTSEIPDLSPADQARLAQLADIRTPPRDERFPSTNQAMRCWNLYNEWILCGLNADEGKCKPMRYAAESICPSHWIEKYDEQRGDGTFSGIGNRFNNAKH